MAQSTSNVVPAAQAALNNAQQSTWAQKQTALRALGARLSAQKTAPSLGLSMAGNPKTVAPIGVSISAKTGGTTTPSGLAMQQPTTSIAGVVNPRTISPANSQPIVSQQFNQGNAGGVNLGNAKTPEQLAADAKANGAATGTGSLDPTVYNPDGTLKATSSTTTNSATDTPYSTNNPPTTQAGLIGSALGQAQGYYNSQQGLTTQAQEVQKAIADMQSRIGGEQAATTGQYNGTASDEAGRIAQLETIKQNTAAAMGQQAATIEAQQAKQAGYESPLTSTYGTAINAAAPQFPGYNQQVYNPLTQSFGNTGGGTGTAMSQLPAQGQTAVKSYASQVKSGAMTRADAESRLSAYGIAGTNALNEALGSGFNTNASNASAVTTAQGQQIQTAAQSTNAALDTLSTAFANLSPLQTAGIPATNSIANWIGQALGDQELQQFRTNLADARSQLIGVLNSSGGTPTGNEATAYQYLPDNMTKAQFDANVGTAQNPGIVRQLVAQKVNAFTQSGQQSGNTNQNAPSNIYSW